MSCRPSSAFRRRKLRPLATGCFGSWMGTEARSLPIRFFLFISRHARAKTLRLTQQVPTFLWGVVQPHAPTSTPQQRCCVSGLCSQGRPPGSRQARSCASRRCSGCVPPGCPCGRCLMPWWTGASSGVCPRAGGSGLAVGVGRAPRGCTCRSGSGRLPQPTVLLCLAQWAGGDSGTSPSPTHPRQLREPEGVKTSCWQRWQRRQQTAERRLGEAVRRLAQGFGLWEEALYEIGGRTCTPTPPSLSGVSVSSLES